MSTEPAAPVIDNPDNAAIDDPDYPTFDEFSISPEEEAEFAAQAAAENDGTGEDELVEGEPAVVAPDAEADLEANNEVDYAAIAEAIDGKYEAASGRADELINELEELAGQLDDGDIGQGAYDVAKLRIDRELRSIDSQITALASERNAVNDKVESSQAQQQAENAARWQNEVTGFLAQPENQIFNTDADAATQFDATLASMDAAGLFEGLTMPQVLASVRQQLAIRIDLPAASKAAPVATNKPRATPKIPPSTNMIPATEANDDSAGEFAYIHKLSGAAYEKALSEMSPEQQARFDRSAF